MPYRTADKATQDYADEEIASGKKPWWQCPLTPEDGEVEPHEVLDKVFDDIRDDQDFRYEAYRQYEKCFLSNRVSGEDSMNMMLSDELIQNELANTIETLWAQVFKTKIVPACCVSEADFDQWFRAKAYGRWLEGALDDAEVFENAVPKAGLYALVYGTGPIKVYGCKDGKKGQVKCCAVNPKYLMVDRLSAKHGKPRAMFQKDHIDKWELLETLGEGKGLYGDEDERKYNILRAKTNDDIDLETIGRADCDMVTVKEAWRLPSKKGADDGRHCIWITGCTLVYEEFDWECFPFAFIRFGAPLEGFWGESAVKRLFGTQKLMDKLNKKIDQSQDVIGVPRILVGKDSGLKKVDLDDVPGGILEVNNVSQVTSWVAESVASDLYSDRNDAPRKMRSLLGVSDFEVQQQLPAGMRDISGDFLERLTDQGQARHAMFHKEYENAIVKLGYLFMSVASDLDEDECKVTVKAPGSLKSSVESLDFKDVKVDAEAMKLRILPMSQLPQTFSGKIEAIQKLQEIMPNMAPQTVARMTEVPDVDGQTDMMVSDEEIIMKNLTFMVKKKKFLPPLTFDNHKLIVALTTRFLNMYRVKDDHNLTAEGILVKYIEEASALGKLGGPDPNAPPPVPSLPPVGPNGMPMAAPGYPPPAPGGPLPPPGPLPGGPPAGPMPPM